MISARITLMNTGDGPAVFDAGASHIDSMTGGVWWDGTPVDVVVELIDSQGNTMIYDPGGNWTTFLDGGITHTGTLTWNNSSKRYTGRLTMTDETWGDTSSARYLRVSRNGVEVGRKRYYYYTNVPNASYTDWSNPPTTPLQPNAVYTAFLNVRDRFDQPMKSASNITNFTFTAEQCSIYNDYWDSLNKRWVVQFRVDTAPSANARIVAYNNGQAWTTFEAPVDLPLQNIDTDIFAINSQNGTYNLDTSGKQAGDVAVVVMASGLSTINNWNPPSGWTQKGNNYFPTTYRCHTVLQKTYTGGSMPLTLNGAYGCAGIVYWFRGGGGANATFVESWQWNGGKANRTTSSSVQGGVYYIDSLATSKIGSTRVVSGSAYSSASDTTRDVRISGTNWLSGFHNSGTRTISMTGTTATNEEQALLTFYVS